MMYLKLLLGFLGICAVAFVATANHHKGSLYINKNEIEGNLLESDYQWYQNRWPNRWPNNRWPDNRWDKRPRGFRCPAPFGVFSDITDCEYFYACRFHRGNRKKCPEGERFDKNRKQCLSWAIAVCDTGEKDYKPEPVTPSNPVNNQKKFMCPSFTGYYADEENCEKYYYCIYYVPAARTCPYNQLFDGVEKKCKTAGEVHCGSRKRPVGEKTPDPTPNPITIKKKFMCPTFTGYYIDEEDCSQYYYCRYYIPAARTCPYNQLFDGVEKKCKTAGEVHCGSRKRPGEETTLRETTTLAETTVEETTLGETTQEETTLGETTPEKTTLGETTQEEATPLGETTPEKTTLGETTPEETTLGETTIEETTLRETTTTEQTTPIVHVTAPETKCDEDDVDCIISDLGKKPKWFICPTDMRSFPHPSSKKLFIFCINWKPSVKKCAHGLIFSEERQTCVKT